MTTKRLLALTGAACLGLCIFSSARSAPAQTNSAPHATLTTWAVSIVLPPKLRAGGPATLAVLGVDGRLAPDVKVDIGNSRTVTTDQTGRAFFTAPAAGGVLLAKASGAALATLIDSSGAAAPAGITIPPVISVRDGFPVCGAGFRGDSDGNHAWIDNQPALVLAASSECVVILPGPYTQVGPATVSIEAPGVKASAATTVVSLEFLSPDPPLAPGKKGRLIVRARGTNLKLRIAVENRSPGILRFLHGDAQELVTSGGDPDIAALPVEAVSSGDFSFRARLLPVADPAAAQRYLEAAASLALVPTEGARQASDLARRLAHHPRDSESVRRELSALIVATLPGDFRALLTSALSSL